MLGLGPIMVPRIPSLRVVEISCFFPGRVSPMVLTPNEFQPPEFYIQFFESAMKDKAPILYTPVRYYENGEPFMTGDPGFQVLVTQFDTEERGGETGDFYYDLELTEYKDYSPVTMQIQTTTNQTPEATTEPARSVPSNEIVVGSICLATGKYWYTSYGESPWGQCSGKRVKVVRIVNKTRAAPYLIQSESGGALGWAPKSILQVVSS